jgi:hypothetical protein
VYRIATLTLALSFASATAQAAPFVIDVDPFAGSDALATPGRQVVGNGVEPAIDFDVANDQFVIDLAALSAYGFGPNINFANGAVDDIPVAGANVVVLQTLDNDANPLTPFLAGNAANLLAARITTPGSGFFIYFNSALDLPRLVFSTNLDDETADLKIVARLNNFLTHPEFLPLLDEDNFATVPEPTVALLLATGAAAFGRARARRRR